MDGQNKRERDVLWIFPKSSLLFHRFPCWIICEKYFLLCPFFKFHYVSWRQRNEIISILEITNEAFKKAGGLKYLTNLFTRNFKNLKIKYSPKSTLLRHFYRTCCEKTSFEIENFFSLHFGEKNNIYNVGIFGQKLFWWD